MDKNSRKGLNHQNVFIVQGINPVNQVASLAIGSDSLNCLPGTTAK